MNFKEACIILEIDDSEEPSAQTIKKRYRTKALRYHPDKNKSENASAKFLEIQCAYEYLLKNVDYESTDSDEEECSQNENRNNYKNILFSFLKNIIKTDSTDSMFRIILNKISNTCEDKALETLEKLDKSLLIKIHEMIRIHKEVFHFSGAFFDKLDELLKKKIRNDECIILNPQLDDLFENNLYKLKVGDSVYAVPLWHHELIYDNSGSDVYVKCNPILPDNVTIDNKNNIYVNLHYKIEEIWGRELVEFKVGRAEFSFPLEKLNIIKRQTYVLEGHGISKINTVNVYDISKKADVIVEIEIS